MPQKSQTGFIPSDIPLMILNYLNQQNVDTTALCAELGLDIEDMREGSGLVSSEAFSNIWKQGVLLTGNPHFGLHLGEQLLAHSHGHILFSLIQNCPTLEIAADYFAKYNNIVHGEGAEICIEKTKTHISIPVMDKVGSENSESHFQELLTYASSLTAFFRHLSQHTMNAESVHFSFDEPDDLTEFNKVFKTSLYFNQPRTEIRFLRSEMQISPPFANPELKHALESHIKKRLREKFSSSNWSDRVANQLGSMLYSGDVSIDAVAASLNTSPRTLQGKLKEEVTTFRAIWDKVRREVAEHYLAGDDETLVDIAVLLGYSEQSAFTKAFKQWTGFTPNQFRKQHQAA